MPHDPLSHLGGSYRGLVLEQDDELLPPIPANLPIRPG